MIALRLLDLIKGDGSWVEKLLWNKAGAKWEVVAAGVAASDVDTLTRGMQSGLKERMTENSSGKVNY